MPVACLVENARPASADKGNYTIEPNFDHIIKKGSAYAGTYDLYGGVVPDDASLAALGRFVDVNISHFF